MSISVLAGIPRMGWAGMGCIGLAGQVSALQCRVVQGMTGLGLDGLEAAGHGHAELC